MKKVEGTGKIICRTVYKGFDSVCPDVRVILFPWQAVLSELVAINYARSKQWHSQGKAMAHLGACMVANLPDQP